MAVVGLTLGLTLVELPSETWWTAATLSLACGTSALALMAAAAILAARSPVLEGLFGGLDRSMMFTNGWASLPLLWLRCI
jgi:predicted ferric reductase